MNEARDLERENAALKKQLKDMTDQFFTVSAENAALQEQLSQAAKDEGALRRENTRLLEAVLHQSDLRADRDRLNWLLTDEGGSWLYWAIEDGQWLPEKSASRAAIEAALKKRRNFNRLVSRQHEQNQQ